MTKSPVPRCRRGGRAPAPRATSARQDSSAAASASIEPKRSCGRLAIARATTASRRSGTSGRRARTLGTGSRTCRRATAISVSPEYGTLPVSSSYVTTPSEYWSERSSPRWPFACSGEMYWPVPSTVPVAVSASSESSARAIPKSVTFAVPLPSSRTLCGLTSRWTMPRSWAKARARAIWQARSTARSTGSGPSRSITAFRFSPATCSKTMNCRPSHSPRSMTVTTLG